MLFKQLRIQQKAANRRVRDLVRKYVSRLEALQQYPVPMFAQEYEDWWDYRNAAKIFCHETGCNPESAKRFSGKSKKKQKLTLGNVAPANGLFTSLPHPSFPARLFLCLTNPSCAFGVDGFLLALRKTG